MSDTQRHTAHVHENKNSYTNTPFILWMKIFQSRKVKDKYTFVVFFLHKDNMFPLSPTTNLYYKSICIYKLHKCIKSILYGPESTIKRLSWFVIILLCQIIYEALETQILLIKYCDYLSMSNHLYGARETNIVLIVLIVLYTL